MSEVEVTMESIKIDGGVRNDAAGDAEVGYGKIEGVVL